MTKSTPSILATSSGLSWVSQLVSVTVG